MRKVYTLRRAAHGPQPRVRLSAQSGDVPPGLTLSVGDEGEPKDGIATSIATLTFDPRTANAGRVESTLQLVAGDDVVAGDIMFRVDVPAATLTLREINRAGTLFLPPTARTPPTVFRIDASGAGASEKADIELAAVPHVAFELFDGDTSLGVLSIDAPIAIPTGRAIRAAPAYHQQHGETSPGTLGIRLRVDPEQVIKRAFAMRPPLRAQMVSEGSGFRLVDDTLKAERPFVVYWMPVDDEVQELPAEPGVVMPHQHQQFRWVEAPAVAKANRDSSGQWFLIATGPWRGPTPSAVRDHRDAVRVQLHGHDAPIDVPIVVPAQFGKRSWLLAVLAGLALALLGVIVAWLRPPPITGTLLYMIDDNQGTVGRLDLAPVGRSPKDVTTDARGKLSIGGKGDWVLTLRPERIGGMIDVPAADGTRDRRLLVDGLALTVGRHRVRYVSGQPTERDVTELQHVADLYDSSFELETGRVDQALDESTPYDLDA